MTNVLGRLNFAAMPARPKPKLREEIVSLHKRGWSVRRIAASFQPPLTTQAVYYHLKEAGIRLTRKKKNQRKTA